MICDRSLRQDGRLDYLDSGIPGAPWVPEAPGEAMLLNGKLFPYLEVEPRKYRFRIRLNAANSSVFPSRRFPTDQPFRADRHGSGAAGGAWVSVPSMMIAPAWNAWIWFSISRRMPASRSC